MKNIQRTQSSFSLGLLWFGASISIAEILTGALLAPLGFSQGLAAILLGHLIGISALLLVGFIGATSGFSTSEALRVSFGQYGSGAFSFLNTLQLIGWAAVMTISGAKTLDSLTLQLVGYQNESLWCLCIGILNFVWVLLGLKHIFKVNIIVVTTLFLTSLFLGYIVFSQPEPTQFWIEPISFGTAVELNVAMGLSWLPLISDYTRTLKRPVSGTITCAACYGCGSCLMFTIGLGAAIFAETSDIGLILLAAGFGALALVVIIFSTLTTTFMDTYSIGVNGVSLYPKIPQKVYSTLACILATGIALWVPMSHYENFLYLIGSVFSPLFAILLVDFFVFRKKEGHSLLNTKNLLIWLAGFIVYRLLIDYNTVAGITLPVMVLTGCLYYAVSKIQNAIRRG